MHTYKHTVGIKLRRPAALIRKQTFFAPSLSLIHTSAPTNSISSISFLVGSESVDFNAKSLPVAFSQKLIKYTEGSI